MRGYTKLFNRILDSTIWREDDPTRILWVTMLALADQDGIVQCTIPGLADRARITVPQCELALARFQQPDKYSWSKEAGGRRIEEVDGGWLLINHAKYRELMSLEEQRERTRMRVEQWRKRQQALQSVTAVTSNDGNDKHTQKHTHTQKQLKATTPPASQVNEIYQLYPRKVEKREALKAITAAIKRVREGEYKNDGVSEAEAIAGIKDRTALFAQSPAGNRGKYTPYPATWFNRSRYLDDPKEWDRGEESGADSGPTKTERRVANNRKAILDGLDISQENGRGEPTVQNGNTARGDSHLEILPRK
jgi:hypothetical protein